MSNPKYSVLFMRDDANVRRYRLSPFWLKLFLFSQMFLLLCAVGGVYFGMRGWKETKALSAEKKVLEQQLVDTQVRLERLSNMEKILKSYDPKELQALLTSAAEPAPKEPELNLNRIFTRKDTRQVGVENLQAKVSRRKVTVSFELNNLQNANPVGGVVDFVFVRKDGTDARVKVNRNDLTFQIQRFKRIRTTFLLPDGLKADDIFGLRVKIKGDDDKVIFSETYPLYNILA
ncbi:hypothetical protein [Desulfovibrio oxyclinae]|jgi:hypothetical protein|uniref:hypothetical protein n=1 Tax=Desulfovibrio oxyclinae TaxID=63560 RepID=UPI0003800E56|nr:hypothetical protein [Desulfovibrio oxyclinae]